MKIIGYVRVSTDDQAREGVSLDMQRARVEQWARLNGGEVLAVYGDEGISGKRADNRPQLQRALDHACREGAVLVVHSLSRLARSVRDTLDIAERLDKAGADLASLSERLDTSTAAGKMVFRMLAVMAEFERDQTAERTRGAMAYKRSKGERVGRFAPYGYQWEGDRLAEIPSEQRTLRLIRQRRESGASLRVIAHELNSRGIKPRTSNRWYASVVSAVAKREAARSL